MTEEKKAMTKAETGAVAEPRKAGEEQTFQPAVDVVETADAIVLTADMPGVGKDDVEIRVEKDVLTLVGKVSRAEDEGRPVYVEYKKGDFVRSFTLTEDVDRDRIGAEMQKGVLTLTIPKAEKTKPRKVQIRGE